MLNEIIKYYTKAKRTALLAQDNLTNKWFHIFSVIELLPSEIQDYNIPTTDWFENKIIGSKISSKNMSYNYYLIVNDLTSDEAIKLFNSPNTNNSIDGKINNYFNTDFRKEPNSDYPLLLPSNMYSEDGLATVLPKRNCELYVWTQIDFNRIVENQFKSDIITREMRAMSQLTNDWLGFDIWSKFEHVGNIYLVAPNPYFRKFKISLSTNPTGIFYDFKLRKNTRKEKFTIRIIDKHGDAIALDKEFEIKENIGLLELPHEPHLIEIRVYNKNKNLIALHPPSTFIKSIHLDMLMKQADFHVKVNDDKEFVVEKFSKPQKSIVGNKETNFNAEYYFKRAEEERKYISYKKNKEFVFFPGAKTDEESTKLKKQAKDLIREIINNSKETCYICDPFFKVKDLIDYAFYIKNSGVKLKILNCKEQVKKEDAKQLHDAINEYNSKPFQKIELRLLRGDCVLHDRFIISDLNVWYLGTSLNEFGKRATTIAKVPKSSDTQIIKEIEKWFLNNKYSVSIEDYISILKDE
ncbi:MAG: phospholipase D family protein [Bacteroidales bacterium]|nr:phospholipase D family protein [Bacteroidales bacterium]